MNVANDTTSKINKLKDKILIIKDDEYRVSDVVKLRGQRWLWSENKIIDNESYDNSILKLYLIKRGFQKRGFKIRLLYQTIEKFAERNNVQKPHPNEVVLHLRLGDVVVHDWFLKKDYASIIERHLAQNPSISKITIGTSFYYGEWSAESMHLNTRGLNWDFTDEKHNLNLAAFDQLLRDLMGKFPSLEFDVVSNSDVDLDMVYYVFAQYFIHDEGGFSHLMQELNAYRQSRKKLTDKLAWEANHLFEKIERRFRLARDYFAKSS